MLRCGAAAAVPAAGCAETAFELGPQLQPERNSLDEFALEIEMMNLTPDDQPAEAAAAVGSRELTGAGHDLPPSNGQFQFVAFHVSAADFLDLYASAARAHPSVAAANGLGGQPEPFELFPTTLSSP